MQSLDELQKNWEKILANVYGKKEANLLKKLKGKRIDIGEDMAIAFKQWYLHELAMRERLGEEYRDNLSGILEDVMLDL